jgi:hypothetical protein
LACSVIKRNINQPLKTQTLTYLLMVYLTTLSRASIIQQPVVEWLVNNEREGMGKGEVLLWDLHERTEENHINPQSWQPVSRQKFEPGTSRIWCRNANHFTTMLCLFLCSKFIPYYIYFSISFNLIFYIARKYCEQKNVWFFNLCLWHS